MFADSLSVLLDHVMDRIWPDWHGHGLGDIFGHRRCREAASPDGARDRGRGEESAPRRIDGREHHGMVYCRRVCGWRAKHAVSLGHWILSPLWLRFEPVR